MIKLHDHQGKFVAGIHSAWRDSKGVMAVLPTGGGKTVCFTSIMKDHKGASAAVVHRQEIVAQISLALATLGVKHRVVAPSLVVAGIRREHLKELGRSFVDPHSLAGVVSVQTMTSAGSGKNKELQSWLAQVTLAVFDEGHHYVKQGLWAKAVDALSAAKLLFLTATPERADGKGLGAHADGFAETMVEGPPTHWLIANGYLSPFKYKAPRSDLNMSNIPITLSGDLNTKELRKRVVESHLVGDVVSHYLKFAAGKRAIVFASDVATANEIAEAFRAKGVTAEALSGGTDRGERSNTLAKFKENTLSVLVNVDLFDEGFDVPAADAVILARPTESLAKYLQMVGRVLRPVYAEGYDLSTVQGRLDALAAGPKSHAIVIDPVSNWERHGAPNLPRNWTLDAREKGSRGAKGELIPQRVCPSCTQPYERIHAACPYCGASAPPPSERRRPAQVDGDLVELDIEGMAALFAKMRAADLSEEEYRITQIQRRIPPVGQRADMKRHLEGKHRRAVLRELVGWWVGMQPPDRDLREVHRRFFHRFGTDIGTAFTLKAKETDALVKIIEQRFLEDITE